MSDEDPDVEWAKSVARFFRGLYEDEVIKNAAAALEDMPESFAVPMPNTHHPAYADLRIDFEQVGQTLRVRIPGKINIRALNDEMYPKATEAFPWTDHRLVRKEFVGPAPFVGDPLWEIGSYRWFVWTDEVGRHIAGDATLHIDQRTTIARR